MGNRANSTICLGVHVTGDEGVPWDAYEEDDWWVAETGFARQGPELYTPAGDYINGERPDSAARSAYYAETREWKAAHPLPFEVVTLGSDDEYDVILAVPGTVTSADWDGPIEFDPVAMVGKLHTDLELAAAYETFRRFQAKYKIRGVPVWLLSSYYG